uniref:Uncharacterized protein n=1 Tax=Tetranychus urticae TaxID=32264 RepID=T1KJ64_TETUR
MFKQRNKLFVKRVPPQAKDKIKNNVQWKPVSYDFYSLDSIKPVSVQIPIINEPKDPLLKCLCFFKLVLKTFITIICIFFWFYQISYLANEYFKYEVIESRSHAYPTFLSPPDFSFCLNLIGSLNATEMFIRRPDVKAAVLKVCSTRSNCSLSDQQAVLEDLTYGPKIVYSRMTTQELFQLLPGISSIMASCSFLSANLSSVQCDESYFRTYMYSQKICYEFVWYSSKSPNKTTPVFPANLINLPGYTNIRLLAIQFNLTRFSSDALFDIMIHPPFDLPWHPDKSTKESIIPNHQFIYQSLSYKKTVTQSLPDPYQSNCTDYSELPWRSIQECILNCSLDKFIEISDYYPRYYPIVKFDDHYLSFDYNKRESYQPLIQQLSEKCLDWCGYTECFSEAYDIISLNSGRHVSPGMKMYNLQIFPSSQPTKLLRTTAVHSAEYFIANIGGSIGVWFGYSLYCLGKRVYNFIPRIYQRMKLKFILKRNEIIEFKPTITKFKRPNKN